jgi:hypothetical protein
MMTEDLLTDNPMTEDLLTKIQRVLHERLHELRGAVDEYDRLQADLRELDKTPELPADPEPLAAPEAVLEPPVEPAPTLAPEPRVDPEPAANVVRLPARPRLSRARMVSPKVARLMRAPRRPALERTGVVRVGEQTGSAAGDALFPGVDPVPGVNGVDVEAELFERSF